MRCSKCISDAKDGTVYIEIPNSYALCRFCSLLIEKIDKTGVIQEFLMPHSSQNLDFPFTQVERNMLQAKERRKAGKSHWDSFEKINERKNVQPPWCC